MAKPQKIFIDIEEGHHYAEGVYGGKAYTSVGFQTNRYGSGSPCDNEEEINRSVKMCRERILEEGDIPIVNDKRHKATLERWIT